MRKMWKKTLILFLTAAMTLGGCGSVPVEAPELIEYEFGGENYRPVTRSDMGARVNYSIVVVPVEDPYFWETDVQIKRVTVEVGQYVQAGDVLAEAENGDVEDRLAAERSYLQLLQQQDDLEKKIAKSSHEQTEFEIAGMSAMGDKKGAEKAMEGLARFEEDMRYEQEMRDSEITVVRKNIAELEKLQQDGQLRAKRSGYVTYVKNYENSNMAGKDEGIVVVAREGERYLQVENPQVISDLKYGTRTYSVGIDGKEYELEALEYTKEEKTVLDLKKAFTGYARFVRKDGGELPENGTWLPLYGDKQDRREVLVIGLDSLMADNEGEFVYVRTEKGREVRRIKTGRTDNALRQTEVLEGLSEGEWVFYTTNYSKVRADDILTLTSSEYPYIGDDVIYNLVTKSVEIDYAKQRGIVITADRMVGETVEAGDLLYSIRTENTRAELQSLQNRINSLQENESRAEARYNKSVEDMQKTIEETKLLEAWRRQQLLDLEAAAKEQAQTGTDAEEEEDEETPLSEAARRAAEYGVIRPDYLSFVDPYGSAQLEKTLEQMQYSRELEKASYNYQLKEARKTLQKAKENNDGQGVVSVYAEHSGVLKHYKAAAGDMLEANEKTYVIESEKRNSVVVKSTILLPLGTSVSFTGKTTGNVYEGKIVGTKADGRTFLSEVDGEPRVAYTEEAEESGFRTYYVRVEGEEFNLTGESFRVCVQEGIQYGGFEIPFDALNWENIEGENYSFVWCVKNGEQYKVYTEYDEASMPSPEFMFLPDVGEVTIYVTNGLKEGDELAVERGAMFIHDTIY